MTKAQAKQQGQDFLNLLETPEFKGKIQAIVAELVTKGVENAMADMHKAVELRIDAILKEKDLQIQKLEEKVNEIEAKSEGKDKVIDDLTIQLDDANQYSRRNCLIISGIKKPQEGEQENTEDKIIDLCRTKMKIAENEEIITKTDIDRCHRLGDRIIVKFTSYKARARFYSHRKDEKLCKKDKEIYISESLTQLRGKLLFDCRQYKKEGKITASWTNDGVVKVKLLNNSNHVIKKIEDLEKLL